MPYKVTSRTIELVGHLRRLADLVQPLLDRASPAARHEWAAFQSTWPSDTELRQRMVAISDSALETIHAKASRFREILQSLAPAASEVPGRTDRQSNGDRLLGHESLPAAHVPRELLGKAAISQLRQS